MSSWYQQGQNICTNCDKFIANERYKSPCYNSVGNYMSKEVLMLTIIIVGTTTIATLLSTSTISLVGQILPLPSITTVWELNVTGTQDSDTLIGTNKSDNIRGHGEDDMISGLEGNDGIAGDMGDDTIHGDRGHDGIRAGEGNDLIFGDSGDDNLFGGPDDDSLTGGPGKDSYNCGEGTDTVIDFDPSKNETISTNCENTSSSPPPLTTTGGDIAINAPEPPAEDFAINSFNTPLEEDEDGDGEEEEVVEDFDGNGGELVSEWVRNKTRVIIYY